MLNIERYIVREVAQPLAAVSAIMVGLFASFSGARYLSEAVTETLGISIMLQLILLKTVIALEVLIPIAFYASVVIGLGRLHRDQEIIALQAAGIGGFVVIRAVLILAIPISILVGCLSLVGRPWAYQTSYALDASANAEFNTDRFQAGRFYGNEDSGGIIYIQEKDSTDGQMRKVFHYQNKDGSSEIILARNAHRKQPVADERPELHLGDGIIYKLLDTATTDPDSTDVIVHFKKLVLFLNEGNDTVEYKRKAATTRALLMSDQRTDIAELQWRLSRPLATILLALLAIHLSRTSPRQGRGEKTLTAALVFAVYYNLSGLAQTWVEQGVVGKFPGVWWLHALMFMVVAKCLLPEWRDYLSRKQPS